MVSRNDIYARACCINILKGMLAQNIAHHIEYGGQSRWFGVHHSSQKRKKRDLSRSSKTNLCTQYAQHHSKTET